MRLIHIVIMLMINKAQTSRLDTSSLLLDPIQAIPLLVNKGLIFVHEDDAMLTKAGIKFISTMHERVLVNSYMKLTELQCFQLILTKYSEILGAAYFGDSITRYELLALGLIYDTPLQRVVTFEGDDYINYLRQLPIEP